MIEDGQKELELEKKIREKKVRYNELRIRFGLLPVPLEDLMTWKFDPALKKTENRGSGFDEYKELFDMEKKLMELDR